MTDFPSVQWKQHPKTSYDHQILALFGVADSNGDVTILTETRIYQFPRMHSTNMAENTDKCFPIVDISLGESLNL